MDANDLIAKHYISLLPQCYPNDSLHKDVWIYTHINLSPSYFGSAITQTVHASYPGQLAIFGHLWYCVCICSDRGFWIFVFSSHNWGGTRRYHQVAHISRRFYKRNSFLEKADLMYNKSNTNETTFCFFGGRQWVMYMQRSRFFLLTIEAESDGTYKP